jgi:hypothetical protein
MQALLHMLRTGLPYPQCAAAGQVDDGSNSSSTSSHRAAAALGPTSVEALQEAMAASSIRAEGAREGGGSSREGSGPAADPKVPAAGAEGGDDATAAVQAALRAADAAGDAVTWARLLRLCRVRLVAGDFLKQVTGRRGLVGAVAAATLGHMHAHLAGAPGSGVAGLLAPGAPLLVEAPRGMVQLSDAQAAAFEARSGGLVATSGVVAATAVAMGGPLVAAATAAGHVAFVRAPLS